MSRPSRRHVRRHHSPTPSGELLGSARETWLLLSLALAFASGIAQLSTSGPWQIVLAAIFGLSLIYFTVRAIQLYISHTRRGLRLRLSQYQEVLADITIRHQQAFGEDVEVVFRIGDRGEPDTVIERRCTKPAEYVLYRDIYLARNLERPMPSIQTIVPDLRIERGAPYSLTWLPLQDSDGLHGMVLFRPAVTEETTWRITYDSPKLWEPLRETGVDYCRFSFRDGKMNKGGRFTVHFIFPSAAKAVLVRPDGNWCTISEAIDPESGRRMVTCVVEHQDRNKYFWDLAMSDRIGDLSIERTKQGDA